MNNLIKTIEQYNEGTIDVEDVVWEATKCGLNAVPLNNATYLCKDGSWLIRLEKNKIEFSKELTYLNVINDVV